MSFVEKSQYEPGQQVEVYVGPFAEGRWISATLLNVDGLNYSGCQWTFRLNGTNDTGFCVERWIRLPHALIQLAELAD